MFHKTLIPGETALHMPMPAIIIPGRTADAPSLVVPEKQGKIRARTTDGFQTFDARTVDSTGAFLVGELERLDQRLNEPLTSYTWSRDIDLREDVTIADEQASFTNSSFAAAGGLTPGGKAWIGKDTTTITGVALDIGKTVNPLFLWAMEIGYTLPELESSMKVGRPVDSQKFSALQLKWNMDVDEQVYIGDSTLGVFGLTNLPVVTPMNAVNGASASALWASKTPDEILADVNTLINAAWAASAYTVAPTELRIPPALFGTLVSKKVSDAGNISIIEFLRQNSLSNTINGSPLNIQPLKWLVGRGVGSTQRIMVYTKSEDRIRFPLVPLQRTPLEYRGLYQLTYYYGRIGVVETPYPETIAYMDGV